MNGYSTSAIFNRTVLVLLFSLAAASIKYGMIICVDRASRGGGDRGELRGCTSCLVAPRSRWSCVGLVMLVLLFEDGAL